MAEGKARASREVWAKRVERWRDSGLTAPEFARELGINPSTLTYWKYVLKRDAAGSEREKAAKQPSRRGRASRPAASSFVTVEAQSPSTERFEVELGGGRRLVIPASFDDATLRRLVRALEPS